MPMEHSTYNNSKILGFAKNLGLSVENPNFSFDIQDFLEQLGLLI